MATKNNRDRVISFLETYTDGIDDGKLAEQAGIKTRQQANKICRELESEGFLNRVTIDGLIQNFWIGNSDKAESQEYEQKLITKPSDSKDKSQKVEWFTKSNVQASVIKFLRDKKFSIQSDSETDSHQKQIDILAEKNQRFLCVSVQGYPEGDSVEDSVTQAENRFQQAMFDMIRFRQMDKKFLLAVALPDFQIYKSLLPGIVWFKDAAKFNFLWVSPDGSVVMD